MPEARLYILATVWLMCQHRIVNGVWARFQLWLSPELPSLFGRLI
jgi:hypothetical protein